MKRTMLFLFNLFIGCVHAGNVIIIPGITCSVHSDFYLVIQIDNTSDIVAFQLDLKLPEGFTYQNSYISSGRITDHQILITTPDTGFLRIIAFSITNSCLKDSTGEVLSLKLSSNVQSGSYEVNIVNPILADPTSRNVLDDVKIEKIVVQKTSGIKENMEERIQSSLYPNPSRDKSLICYNALTNEKISISLINMLGEVINQEIVFPEMAGSNHLMLNTSDLCPGFYLVNIIQGRTSTTKKLLVMK